MEPQRRLGIYVGFDSPSIIRYLESLTGDMFTAHFADCHFDETVFPSLEEKRSFQKNGKNWHVLFPSYLILIHEALNVKMKWKWSFIFKVSLIKYQMHLMMLRKWQSHIYQLQMHLQELMSLLDKIKWQRMIHPVHAWSVVDPRFKRFSPSKEKDDGTVEPKWYHSRKEIEW